MSSNFQDMKNRIAKETGDKDTHKQILDSKEHLIGNLINERYLKTKKIISVFREVPRENFVLPKDYRLAYADTPLPILAGQTISAPHMVAMQTELLEPKANDVVLEIGSGSGYQAAILSKLVRQVYSVETDIDLGVFAKKNLEGSGISNVEVVVGNGKFGYPQFAPYDKIIVTCASPEIFQSWTDQLREGGTIVVPVNEGAYQELIKGVKKDGKLVTERHGSVAFVPLVE